jgi:hypothetical protein
LIAEGDDASQYFNMMSHGTSPKIGNSDDCKDNDYQELAKKAWYNSAPKFANCLPYTANLLWALNYFSKIYLVKPVALLAPLVNALGSHMINNGY